MTETTSYQVRTSVFEGPLEILLTLIEERKLFVNEISLSAVTDDYLAYTKKRSELNLLEMSGFLVVAATLILIKSRSLLPNIVLSQEEKGQIDELETRLKTYQLIKEISREISFRFGRQIIFPAGPKEIKPFFSPDLSITRENILASINNCLRAMPQKEFRPEVDIKKVITLEEMISSLVKRIEDGLQFSFSQFSKSRPGETVKERKINIIVSFLAILELIRQGMIEVIQGGHFEEIEIYKSQKTLNEIRCL